MSTTYIAEKLEDLDLIAGKIIQDNPFQRIFLLEGVMGAGKTTLTKSLCNALGSKDNITSPTFSIVNEYIGDYGEIYHFDFYRIDKPSQAFDIGFEEYIYSGNYCFIEWGERVKDLLPNKYVIIEINELHDRQRQITTRIHSEE